MDNVAPVVGGLGICPLSILIHVDSRGELWLYAVDDSHALSLSYESLQELWELILFHLVLEADPSCDRSFVTKPAVLVVEASRPLASTVPLDCEARGPEITHGSRTFPRTIMPGFVFIEIVSRYSK